jgi:Ca2+-dependent lipid-binding protein
MAATFLPSIEEVSENLSSHKVIYKSITYLGKSDPFAIFSLNGHKIFKSQIKKKTLDPEWNENFTVPVVCIML